MPGRLRRHDELGHVHFVTFCCFRRIQFFRHDGVKSAFIRAMEYVRNRLAVQWIGYVIMPEHVHLLVLPEVSVPHPALRDGVGHPDDGVGRPNALRNGVGHPNDAVENLVDADERGAPSRAAGRDGGLTALCETTLPAAPTANYDYLIPISKVLHELKGASGRWCKEALRDVWRARGTLGTRALDAWATSDDEKPFWKPRGYDFNVIEENKVWEKLDYIHKNPVRRELVEHPAQWPWNSFSFYESGEHGLIRMDWDSRNVLGV